MPLLHHLARTGGTLLCRCLASMDSVYLLSEINPQGVAHFNPLRQAADWYGLVAPEEIFDFQGSDLTIHVSRHSVVFRSIANLDSELVYR